MAAPNPCAENNGNCSHLCLLSSAVSEGYTCACPDGLVNSEDQNVCRGETHNLNSSLTSYILFTFLTVPPYLLFTYYTGSYNYIQRSRLDGSERVNIYRSGRPRALAFDYK